MRLGRVLRHAAEIELCLEEEDLEEIVLSGPLPSTFDIGGNFGADRAYSIADDGRVERMDAPVSETRLYDLLPPDTDAVLIVDFMRSRTTLYTVQHTLMASMDLCQYP